LFGLKVSFLFGKQERFQKGCSQLIQDWGENGTMIVEYVEAARAEWYQDFNDFRNSIEHKSPIFPSISYELTSNGKVKVLFPVFRNGQPLLTVLHSLEYSMLELVERCILFFFSTKLLPGMIIKQIPPEHRNPDIVVLYRLYGRFGDQDVPYAGSL
jgi:hypothetical protein